MQRKKIIAIVLVLAAAGVAAWMGFALFVPYQGYAAAGIFVDIPRGTPARGVARILASQGVVRSALAFELLSRWRGRAALQAGEYRFDRPMTALEVHRHIAEGRVFVQTILVPEGLTILDLAGLFEEKGLVKREAFLAAARETSLVADLAPGAKNLEGFLFPATYQFPRRIEPAEAAAAMVRRFREVWASLPEEGRNPHKLSPAEIVTLASLVEKETGLDEERPVVAGVFYNRLQRGLALQCDPTVIYALRLADRYRGTLSTADLMFNSPYNTYRRRGLPPGPIASPGAASLRAVLYPPKTDYLYFVSNMQGGHFFAKTLAEHNRNVVRYRRMQAEAARAQTNRASSAAASPAKSARARGS